MFYQCDEMRPAGSQTLASEAFRNHELVAFESIDWKRHQFYSRTSYVKIIMYALNTPKFSHL